MKYGIIELHDLYDFNAPNAYKELVKCGDCKWWKNYECQCEYASTDQEGGASYTLDRDADDFCSFGEREGER